MIKKFIKKVLIFLLILILSSGSIIIYCKKDSINDAINYWIYKETKTCKRILFNIQYFTAPEGLEAKWGRSSMGECCFCTAEVGGSTPLVSTNKGIDNEMLL